MTEERKSPWNSKMEEEAARLPKEEYVPEPRKALSELRKEHKDLKVWCGNLKENVERSKALLMGYERLYLQKLEEYTLQAIELHQLHKEMNKEEFSRRLGELSKKERASFLTKLGEDKLGLRESYAELRLLGRREKAYATVT